MGKSKGNKLPLGKHKYPFLVGNNIYLRPLAEQDLEGDYLNWFNDSEVCQYNSHHVFPMTKEKAEEYIKKVSSSGTDLVLAIVLNTNNRHIGNISLQNINYVNRSAEFAIIIGDKKSWGKGYGQQATHLIIKHGFKQLNLHRIYLGTSVENIAMQKLAKAVGMSQEGIRKEAMFKNGQYRDIVEYGILDSQFLINIKKDKNK